jgi:hypothetical protein
MKLPGHRPGLPGNVISFYIVPLDPAYSARTGLLPVTDLINSTEEDTKGPTSANGIAAVGIVIR